MNTTSCKHSHKVTTLDRTLTPRLSKSLLNYLRGFSQAYPRGHENLVAPTELFAAVSPHLQHLQDPCVERILTVEYVKCTLRNPFHGLETDRG